MLARVAVAVALCLAVPGALWVRYAPSTVAEWHRPAAELVPESAGWAPDRPVSGGAVDRVATMPGGAYLRQVWPDTTPAALLARLDAIAGASPRTVRLAGTPQQGRITWVSRSAFWGFPDYTTAEAAARGADTVLLVVARQRFGRRDLGVNARRLEAWRAGLLPSP